MSAAPAPIGRAGDEWLRHCFAETVALVIAGERVFVKHPSGRWAEADDRLTARFYSGPAYYGVELPPPARTHHRVSAGSISYSDGIRRDLWWCLGCNEQGDGAPPLHPQPRKEVPA